MEDPLLTADWLRIAAHKYPDRDAYVHGNRRGTYQWLDRCADGFAATLMNNGVKPGDVLALLLPSSIKFAVCYLGALRVGAITSAINLRLGPYEQLSILRRTQPVVGVVGDGVEIPAEISINTIFRLPDLKEAFGAPPPKNFPNLKPTHPTCIVWTSGTTGDPKGAIYDHQAQEAISRNIGELTRPGDRRLVVLPFAHVGYMTRMWDELANATTIVLGAEPWSPKETLRIIRDESITMATGVPTQWQLLLEHPDLEKTEFSNVRVAGIGAAAISPDLIGRLRESLGCPFITRYTSTEAGVTTSTHTSDPDEVVTNTVGQPAPEVDLLIIDESGSESPPGEVGEVICKSPAMMLGYWEDPELTGSVIDSGGWLHTGDLGYIRADGNLVLVGRKKEMYIRGGYNVYPVEIEAILTEHPAINRVAVIGVDDPVLGEIGVACLVTAPGAKISLAEVQQWCTDRLADYKAPDRIMVLDELPLTPMLKIDKKNLAAHYQIDKETKP